MSTAVGMRKISGENLRHLITKCKRQNRQAQEKIYKIFSPKFFSLCLKYSADYEQAKDNLQDGFIKIFQNIDQFKGQGSFEGWMTRIIINTALSSRERLIFLSIDEEYVEDEDIEDEVEVDEKILSREFLLKVIEDLPNRYRIVFNLYYVEELSHKEISAMLGISESTSKSTLSRARVRLKERIEAAQNYKNGTKP